MTDSLVLVTQGNFIAPVADMATALRRYQAVKDFIESVLKPKVDFGTIPGSDKPALLKPGAEKMCSFFGLTPKFPLEDREEDWTGERHGGEPFFYYRYKCQLYRGDQLIAEGEGSCNSWEKKYRYRQAERVCPKCGKATIIKGKEEYGGGWLCFTKKGGCNAKFAEDAPEIINQQLGQIKNPDPADIVNTLQKMAQKRALVAPVLIATNTSDYFTQDIEDFIDGTIVTEVIPPVEQPSNPLRPHPEEMPVNVAQAFARKGSDKKEYGDCTDEKLGFKVTALEAKLEQELTQTEQDKVLAALEDISLIRDWRKNHQTGG